MVSSIEPLITVFHLRGFGNSTCKKCGFKFGPSFPGNISSKTVGKVYHNSFVNEAAWISYGTARGNDGNMTCSNPLYKIMEVQDS